MTWQNEQFLEVLRCPVLVVGVGGIGCELLKNLALTGFSNIEIVNLQFSTLQCITQADFKTLNSIF